MKLSLSHWYPGSGVALDCIDSCSLPSFLLGFADFASFFLNIPLKIRLFSLDGVCRAATAVLLEDYFLLFVDIWP